MGAATTASAITSGKSFHQRLHQPLPPLPPPKSRRLRLIRRTLLSRWSRQSYYCWGSRSVTEGARWRYRGGDGRRQEASTGPLLSSGGVTGGADRRHDDRCHGRRGKGRSHGRGRELASPEGRAAPITEEDRRDYWRGRVPELPEGATVGEA